MFVLLERISTMWTVALSFAALLVVAVLYFVAGVPERQAKALGYPTQRGYLGH